MKNLSFFLLFFFLSNQVLHAQVPEMTENTNTVMSMVLLHKMELMDYPNIEKDILNTWDIQKEDLNGNDQTISFTVDGVTFLIAMIPSPVPGEELSNAIDYAYLWKDARTALNNKSHIVVAAIGELPTATLYRYSTQITAILLKHTNSMGVYIGNQTLILSKDFYLEEAATMTEEAMPISLWVYFGMRQNEDGNSVYTYGLKEFGLLEVEIVASDRDMDELMTLIYDIAHYTIEGNIVLNDGETIGMSADQKLKINISNGVHIDGQSIKIDYP